MNLIEVYLFCWVAHPRMDLQGTAKASSRELSSTKTRVSIDIPSIQETRKPPALQSSSRTCHAKAPLWRFPKAEQPKSNPIELDIDPLQTLEEPVSELNPETLDPVVDFSLRREEKESIAEI